MLKNNLDPQVPAHTGSPETNPKPSVAAGVHFSVLPPSLVPRGTVADARARVPADRFRVLVVDDDPVSQRQLAHFLAETGVEVLTAGDGREGLRAALKQSPHLIITDWIMPEMDGPDLCKALRATSRGAFLYIIMLTMHEEEARLLEAFEAGANDYLIKPFNQRVLAARFGAGRRIIELQRELERERDENQRHIGELSVLNRRLKESAMTDALTGLPNRRYAMEQLERAWSAAKRADSPLACMLIDVDNFKYINDNCGHDVGDYALQAVAMLMSDVARKSDIVCRLGGDEFIVICADTNAEAAYALGERARETVESHRMSHSRRPVTITIGVAAREADMQTPTEFLRAADQALLQAKRDGRNCVGLASSGHSRGLSQ